MECQWQWLQHLSIKHQSLEFRIAKLLDDEIEDCLKCEIVSEVDYKISDDTVLRPDVVLICDEQNIPPQKSRPFSRSLYVA